MRNETVSTLQARIEAAEKANIDTLRGLQRRAELSMALTLALFKKTEAN